MWTEEEKSYMQGAAHLVALTAPLEEVEATIAQVKQDQALTAEVSCAIYSDDNWNDTLRKVAGRVCQRLTAERFVLLVYNRDLEKFEICYQTQTNSRRLTIPYLDELNSIDSQMLERSSEAIGVENLEEDLKLMTWREAFLHVGVQALLVCSTNVGQPLEGVVVIGYETARTWNRNERELLRVVSQQVGVILHQWQLQRQTEQQQEINQAIEWGLTKMQQIQELDRLERLAMQQIAQLLRVPLATLVLWQPGRQTAQIVAPVISAPQFDLVMDSPITVHSDNLLQWALQADGLLPLSIDDVSIDTRQWLTGAEIGQILVMTLRTSPEHEPTGIVLVADRLERYWHERQLNAMTILVNQLAWSRRYLSLTAALTTQRHQLEQLNWYKNQRLAEFQQRLDLGVQRLNELSHKKDALASMRYHQIVRQLGGMLADVSPVLRQEQWQLTNEYQTIPLASLLKRAIDRVDGLIKQRQLWSQVHNETNLSVGGDIPKIEFVLHEVLTSACQRSPNGSRLDLWCRPLDDRWLEISVTDNGAIEPRLLEELSLGEPQDWLAPSTLEHPPGLHLVICQAMMQRLGGEFNLHRLEDGRNFSRIVVAIAADAPFRPSSFEPEL
jgi:GAF domain-containing protein